MRLKQEPDSAMEKKIYYQKSQTNKEYSIV
jgi:hypothetical protein